MTRRYASLFLVVTLAMALSTGHAAKSTPLTPVAYALNGTLSTTFDPTTFHASGALCLLPTCDVATAKTRFDLWGHLNTSLVGRCVGIGAAGLTFLWPKGDPSWAYLDLIAGTTKTMVALGSVMTGIRKGMKVVATLIPAKDPCKFTTTTVSGAVAIV